MSRDIFSPLSPTLNLKLAAVQSSLVCSTGKSGGYRGGARGARLTLFLDQTEARGAEILFFLKDWPPLSQGLDDSSPPPPPYLRVWIRYWTATRTVRSTCKAILTTVSDFVK